MEIKNKVLVLGYFGFTTNQLDGQTVKTRNVYDLIKLNEESIGSIKYYDTQQFQYSLLSFWQMFVSILNCNILIYLPAQKNLKYIFPVIFIITKLKKIGVIYIVIGGWLSEFLQKKKIYRFMLSKINAILTESHQLTGNLIKKYSFQNVQTFPNFRIHSFTPSFNQNPEIFKIVYMARIFKEKGVDTVFRLAGYIRKTYGNIHPITIDFYGPIQDDEEKYFKNELERYDFVSYKGILQPDQIHKTLNEYDLLVFPSRYSDEGFPGTIMDAYISGIPVIIPRWRFLPEYVNDGFSGFIFDLDKEEDFFSYVDSLFLDRTQLNKMKHFAYEKSKEYSSDAGWQILKRYLVS